MKAYQQIPARGRLLLSEPFMSDPNFRRSVILLTEHNEEGSLGFMLNRPLSVQIQDLLPDFPEFAAPVSLGGPVQQDSLHYLHRLGTRLEGAEEVLPGVFWGGDFFQLKDWISQGLVQPADVRFFVGYAGWAPQQLDAELKEHSWIISPGKLRYTFGHNGENLWQDVLQHMGGKYREMSHYPEDPSLN